MIWAAVLVLGMEEGFFWVCLLGVSGKLLDEDDSLLRDEDNCLSFGTFLGMEKALIPLSDVPLPSCTDKGELTETLGQGARTNVEQGLSWVTALVPW